MNNDLMKAILSMDSYNRGYNPAIKFGNLAQDSEATPNQIKLGNVTVIANSTLAFGSNVDKNASFYAIAYKDNSTGAITISYRGTDNFVNVPWLGSDNGSDIWNGWGIGGGSTRSKEAELAFRFYQDVTNSVYGAGTDPHAANVNISLTGHSLGGGLAGLVGAVYQKTACAINHKNLYLGLPVV